MSTVHSSIDHHPDLMALRARYERVAESMSAHVTFGLALLTGLYVAASPWIVGFNATASLATSDLIVGIAAAFLAYGFATTLDRAHGMTWTLPVLGVWVIVSTVDPARCHDERRHDLVECRCGRVVDVLGSQRDLLRHAHPRGGHARIIANSVRPQGSSFVPGRSLPARGGDQPQTAPIAAEPTSLAYLASTPVL